MKQEPLNINSIMVTFQNFSTSLIILIKLIKTILYRPLDKKNVNDDILCVYFESNLAKALFVI